MSTPPPAPAPQVAVRGETVLNVEPEVADVGVTVRVRAHNRQIALERCRDRQEEVTAVVQAAGDAVETVETAGVAVYAEPRRDGSPGDPVASIYTRLTIGRLDAVGDLVVALGRLDDVDFWGPNWRLRPDSPAYEQARLAAVTDALRRARQYAAAFGSELTALLEVRDTGMSGGVSQVADSMVPMAMSASRELHLDLSPARQEVHGTVEVRFAMSVPRREVFRP